MLLEPLGNGRGEREVADEEAIERLTFMCILLGDGERSGGVGC